MSDLATLTWSDVQERTLTVATDGGADDQQLAILAQGNIDFADYQAAVGRSVACMRDLGIDVVGDSATQTRGFAEISYSYAASSAGRSDDQTDALAQSCMSAHSMYVESLYLDSPPVRAALEREFEPYRSVVVECLNENDVDVDVDASRDAVLIAATDLYIDRGIECVGPSGYKPGG